MVWHQLTSVKENEESKINSKKSISVPHSKLSIYKNRAFSCVAPVLWNELPDYIRSSLSVPSFIRNLKTHLFGKHETSQD